MDAADVVLIFITIFGIISVMFTVNLGFEAGQQRRKLEIDRVHRRKQWDHYWKGTEDFTLKKCGNVELSPDQVYLFKSSSVGQFRIRGGFTGDITVDGRVVTIWDDQKNVLFECGDYSGRVEIQDNAKSGSTLVKFVHNGAKIQSDFALPEGSWSNTKFDGIFHHDGIKVNQKQLSSDDHENPGTLQIVGFPNEHIIIAGHRPAIVTGNGGFLKKKWGLIQ